MAVNRLIRRPA